MTTIDSIMALVDAYAGLAVEQSDYESLLMYEKRIKDCDLARQALRTALTEALAAQPVPQYNADPSCTTVALSEMILSDCGCSSNNTSLVSRVANRIDKHMRAAQPVREPEMEPSCNKRFPRNAELMLPTKPPVNQWEVHQGPAREPLTQEQIELAYRDMYRNEAFGQTTYEMVEAGIRYAEKYHGIGGDK